MYTLKPSIFFTFSWSEDVTERNHFNGICTGNFSIDVDMLTGISLTCKIERTDRTAKMFFVIDKTGSSFLQNLKKRADLI